MRAQQLRFDGEQLFTTFQGRPETLLGILERPEELSEAEHAQLLTKVCKRFNAYVGLVVLLDAYVEGDENNDLDGSELCVAARGLLDELGELK